MQRAERLLAIALLLQARGKMTAQRLAELLGVSIRTIYRDIDALSLAHIPIATDHGPRGGYYLLNEHHFAAALFTREEAISLVLGGEMVGNYSLLADDNDLHRALLKLEATLPEEYRADVRAAHARILFDTQVWSSRPAAAYLDLIRTALWQGQQLDILYPCADGTALAWWRVAPYGLVYKGLPRRQMRVGIWYLVAFCHDAQEMQTYRVARMQDVQIRADAAEIQPDFDLHAYWQEARRHLEQQVQAVIVTLQIQQSLRHRLRDEMKILREECDGSIIVQVPMETVEEAVSYVLALGPQVVVLDPDAVRQAVARTAQTVAALYSSTEQRLQKA